MKKLILLSLGAVAGLSIVGIAAMPALAQAKNGGNANGGAYGYQQAIKSKAEILGLTEDELKAQLETKTMLQIAEDKGISEAQFQASMQKAAQARWASRGLSQAEIDSRLQEMKERQAAGHESNSADRGSFGQHRHNQ